MPAALPEAFILCGGRGSRLQGVLGDLPKALAEVGGRPFLAQLLEHLAQAGVPRVILCTGVGGDAVADFARRQTIIPTAISHETEPLGTGGALALARPQLRGPSAFVLNGDSWAAGLSLAAFLRAWSASAFPAGLVLTPADGRSDAGQVALGPDGRILALAEKRPLVGACYLSAGVYLLSRALLDDIEPGRPVSIETELLPRWLPRGLFGYVHEGALLDIGTPDRLAAARCGNPQF